MLIKPAKSKAWSGVLGNMLPPPGGSMRLRPVGLASEGEAVRKRRKSAPSTPDLPPAPLPSTRSIPSPVWLFSLSSRISFPAVALILRRLLLFGRPRWRMGGGLGGEAARVACLQQTMSGQKPKGL